MTTSEAGLEFIERRECFSAKAYPDAGGHSIGYGYFLATTEDIQKYLHATITKAEAVTLMLRRIGATEDALNKAITVPVSQQQFDALVSWAYNIGNGAARGSSLMKFLNTGDYAAAGDQFAVWHLSNHRSVDALVERRALEKDLFLNGVYA